MGSTAFLLLWCLVATAYSAKSPVLIWSSSRPLGDLPQSYAGKSVNTDTFHNDFLKPLTAELGQHLVVFLQDKLSLEDFTNHADVYNPNSDGGVFKNVKSTMDDQYSVHLPAVATPHVAIETLTKDFKGQIVRVDNPNQLADLQIKDGESYLFIVQLKPTIGKNEAQAFQENDAAMGECMHHLNKRGLRYSAIYTGMSASQGNVDESFQGRHLLQTVNYDTNGTFYNDSYIMLYYKSINLTISQAEAGVTKKTSEFYNHNDMNVTTGKINETIALNISMKNAGSSAVLQMLLRTTPRYEWVATNETMSYNNENDTSFSFDNMPVNLDIAATLNWTYHCTRLVAKPVVRGYNNTKGQTISLSISGFQLQAFSYNLTSMDAFTDNVWDCVEFFTIPIWMGIITTLVLVMILFFGMTMIANISTMDRFDDPKGKAITITVNE